MKKQLLCGVAASAITVAFGGASFAADMPVKASPPPAFLCNWSGFYAGGHVGYGQATAKGTFFGDSEIGDFNHRLRGFLGGVQVGQNWCANTFVYGWEGDASFMNWKKTYNHTSDADFLSNKLNMLASLRGRLGQTFNQSSMMLYVTGGLAWAHGTATFFNVDVPLTLKSDFNKFGGVVGLGAEWYAAKNWTWRLEGLYYIFDANKSFDDGTHSATDRFRNAFVIRLGLSYKFGDWGKAPVMAKY